MNGSNDYESYLVRIWLKDQLISQDSFASSLFAFLLSNIPHCIESSPNRHVRANLPRLPMIMKCSQSRSF